MQPKPVARIPAQLYLGGLESSVKETDLYALLKRFGEVSHIQLKHLAKASYAFVALKDPEVALAVQKDLNGLELHGKRIQVSRIFDNKNSANIFVKSIPENITPKDLGELFGKYGSVISCKVCYDDSGKSLGYGFVQYESTEYSEAAIKNMNGKVWQGSELHVQYFMPFSSRISNTVNSNLYIRGFPPAYSEEDLKSIFAQYGQVLSVAKMQDNGRAYGFVCFSSAEEARLACEQKNGDQEKEFVWYVTPHMNKIHRKKMLREQYLNQVEEWKKKNLYIRNLDKSIDEARLVDICRAYGQVKSLKICKMENIKYDSDGNCIKEPISKEIAYVLFENEASANVALSELQKKLIEGKKLYVAKWKPRDALRKLINHSKVQKAFKFSQVAGRGAYMPRAMPLMPPMMGKPIVPFNNFHQMARGRGQRAVPPQVPQIIPMEIKNKAVINPGNIETLTTRDLGEKLYPMVLKQTNSFIVGKITGMLLEMDKIEVVQLINDEGRLTARVREAVEVLRKAWVNDKNALSQLPY